MQRRARERTGRVAASRRAVVVLGCLGLLSASFGCASAAPRRLATMGGWAGSAPQEEVAEIDSDESDAFCGEVLVGLRRFRSNELDAVDQQLVTGCRLSARDKDSGLGLEFGLYGSSEEGEEGGGSREVNDASLDEAYFGFLGYVLGARPGLRPYIGGGLSLLTLKTTENGGSDSVDSEVLTVGAYAGMGLALIAGNGFQVALDCRILRSGIEDADYDQIGLIAGISF